MAVATQNNDLISSALERMVNKLEASSKQILIPPSQWLEKYFWIPEPKDPITGEILPKGPIRLDTHQKRIIDEALSRKPDGHFKYSTVVYSAPKKSGKSAVASGVAFYLAATTPFSNIYCLANDGVGSNDRLFLPISTCIKFHKEFNGELNTVRVIPSVSKAFLENGAIIRAINCDAAGEAGSEPTGVFWCYDDKTEILTRDGWKSYSEYTAEDEFATLNSSGKIEYQRAVGIFKKHYSGIVHELSTDRTSLCVTPNHKLYGKFFNSDRTKAREVYKKLPVEEAQTYSLLGTRRESLGVEEYSSPPEFVVIPGTKRRPKLKIPLEVYLKFLGWYLSEGCTHKNDTVVIAQSKYKNPEHFHEIWNLIVELGFDPHEWAETEAIVFYDTRIAKHLTQFGLSNEKYIPKWIKELPSRYVDILLTSYWKGDGYKVTSGRKDTRFSTNSLKMRDDLMEVGVRMGLYVGCTEYQDKRWGKPVYTIRYNPYKGGERFVTNKTRDWKVVEYSGIVHCPSVPNGIVCIRRDGKVQFQGQSELWGYTTDQKRRLWTELTIPSTKYGRAIRWVESYAGFIGVSKILWELYEQGVKESTPHPDFLDLTSDGEPVVRVNEGSGMFCYWDHEQRMIWQKQSVEFDQMEARVHSPDEYQRIYHNRWVSSSGAFIAPEWWDACQDETLPPLLDNRTPAVVAIDAAETNDCAAIVLVTRDPNRPETDVAVRACKIYRPIPGKSVVMLEETIGQVIKDWGAKWNIVCIAYDAFQMAKLVQDYRRGQVTLDPHEIEGMTEEEIQLYIKNIQRAIQRWYYKFSQQSTRAIADKQLYDMVVNRQIHWNPNDRDSDIVARGNDETLTKHMKQAGAAQDKGQYRIKKLSNDLKIDAAVALSMAVERCMTLILDNRENSDNTIEELYQNKLISYEEYMRRKIRATVGKNG